MPLSRFTFLIIPRNDWGDPYYVDVIENDQVSAAILLLRENNLQGGKIIETRDGSYPVVVTYSDMQVFAWLIGWDPIQPGVYLRR